MHVVIGKVQPIDSTRPNRLAPATPARGLGTTRKVGSATSAEPRITVPSARRRVDDARTPSGVRSKCTSSGMRAIISENCGPLCVPCRTTT